MKLIKSSTALLETPDIRCGDLGKRFNQASVTVRKIDLRDEITK